MAVAESRWVAFTVLVLVAASGVTAWLAAPGWNWILILILLTAIVLVLGKALTGRIFGVLITERKIMSLSRFQMMIWTLLIVSAFLAIAMERVKSGEVAEPLVIGVDWQVWALLGISTTSLVGTPLLNGNKTRKEPLNHPGKQQTVVEKTAETFNQSTAAVEDNRTGVLYGNPSIDDARFTDLFEGEELVNAQFLDLGKVQLFFFTVIIAMVYAVQLFQLIAHNDLTDDVSLPTVNEGLLALLGVSHAGYLGTKGITQTPST